MLKLGENAFSSHLQQKCAYWIYLEIMAFYMYLVSAMIYLLFV